MYNKCYEIGYTEQPEKSDSFQKASTSKKSPLLKK